MPARDEHLQKAGHNESFVSSFNLDSTLFLDWVVTGIFYAALHYVDAYLARNNYHPKFHAQRNALILKDSNLGSAIWQSYRDFQDDSWGARYKMQEFTAHEVRTQILPYLNSLKAQLKGHVVGIP